MLQELGGISPHPLSLTFAILPAQLGVKNPQSTALLFFIELIVFLM